MKDPGIKNVLQNITDYCQCIEEYEIHVLTDSTRETRIVKP